MSDWQPIETAPRDRGEILVWQRYDDGSTQATFARWHKDHWCSGEIGIVQPTHWIDLLPPKSGAAR